MTQVKQGKKGCGCLPLTLFAVVSIGAGFYFGRNLLGSELTPKSSAKIIPKSAFVTSYIDTDIDAWSRLSEFASAETQEVIEKKLENFAEGQFKKADSDIDYEKDIAPWLGGVSLALLPSTDAGMDLQPVAIFGLKNKFQAWRFFSRQEKLMDSEVEKSKYKKIAVYKVPEYDIWATVFDDYLVISESEQGIQAVIDTYKGQPSLTDLETTKTLPKNPIFQVYFPQYDRFLLEAMEDFSPNINSDKLSQSQLGKFNSMMMNLSIEDYGVNFKTIVNLDEKTAAQTNKLEVISHDLLSQIPQETILMVSGGNLDKMWQNIEAERKNIPELDKFINQAETFVSSWLNLDLEKNFISWLDGEFAFAIDAVSNNQVKGSLLLESSNQSQGNITLEKLTDMAKRSPSVNIQQNNIKGINVTEVSSFGRNILSYGWLNKNNLLLTIGRDFKDIVNLNKKNSLVNDQTFQLTTQSLPQKNYGYFYLDVQKTIATTKTVNPRFFDNASPEIKALSESLKAIAISTSAPNSNTAQFDINLSLEKNN